MSKSEERALDAEQDEHQNDSVFDFLYHDPRRIGSFLAQFDSSGHLQEVRQGESVAKSAKRGWSINAGADVPIVGGGNVGFSVDPGEKGSETLERIYDPLWTNARTFLDFVEERHLLVRDLTKARIGQFVLARGSLSLMDLGTMSKVWSRDVFKKAIRQGAGIPQANRSDRRKQLATTGSAGTNEIELLLELMQIFPHTLQGGVRTLNREGAWFNLRSEFLSTDSADLLLKHGVSIAGDWSVVGILDAMPDKSEMTPTAQARHMIDHFGLVGGLIGTNFSALLTMARQTLGRSTDSYGITPLMIFREVSV